MSITVHWFRRDLRLDDNTALNAALANSDTLIPLFILDDLLLKSSRGGVRIGFLENCLRALDAALRQHGTRLVVRRGDPTRVLYDLMSHTGATRLTYNRDYSPYARQRDKKVVDFLRGQGLVVETYQDLVLHEFKEILSEQQKPLQIFTPYRRRWDALPKPLPQGLERPLPPLPQGLAVGEIPSLNAPLLPDPITTPGEAQKLLKNFVAGALHNYHVGRDLVGEGGTSRLSPHLRWGTLSIRRCHEAAAQVGGEGAKVWISELAWRDFYQMILAHYPHVLAGSFRVQYDRIAWENNPEWFAAWCEGRTGYPIVDAAMRQLRATGWMHNRARMIVASFLCKDLLIDWRWGEQFFMQHLLDGDTAANNGGWQWAAGTGTDAAPYFRIFNPVAQGQKFDPEGIYVRRWLPELAPLAPKFIHAPWTAAQNLNYPAPMVEHRLQREKALAMYSKVKEG